MGMEITAQRELSALGIRPRILGLVTGRECPLCGGNGEARATKEGVTLRVCLFCNVLLAWAFESPEDYESQYDGEYHSKETARIGLAPTWERDEEYQEAARARLKLLSCVLHPGALVIELLDVGAGSGAFVAVAEKEFGFEAAGIEPCPHIVEWANRNGRETMRRGTWHDIEGKYDVITLHDVLEHILDPYACLKRIAQHLRTRGIVVIEWPEWDSPDQRRSGFDWRHIKPRQHPCLYSDRAARRLFERCGFDVIGFFRPMGGSIGKAAYYLQKASDIS